MKIEPGKLFKIKIKHGLYVSEFSKDSRHKLASENELIFILSEPFKPKGENYIAVKVLYKNQILYACFKNELEFPYFWDDSITG